MGIDVYLRKHCSQCGHDESIYEGAYTYNVSPMWHYVYPLHEKMLPIDDMPCKDAILLLCEARSLFQHYKDKLTPMNPENGFGSYDGFMLFLNEIIDISAEYPELIWGVWR